MIQSKRPTVPLTLQHPFRTLCVLALILLLAAPIAAAEDATSYNDTLTNLSFTLPSGWEESALTQPRQTIDVKYASTDPANKALIMYGSYDIRKELVQYGITTNDMPRDRITDEFLESGPYADDFKRILGIAGMTDLETSSETYADVHWFHYAYNYGSGFLTVHANAYIHIINGYCCSFQFFGFEDSDPTMEQILSTVTILPMPAAGTETGEHSSAPASSASTTLYSGNTSPEKDASFSYALRRGIITMLVVIAIPVAIIIITGRSKKKKKQTPSAACFCMKCGKPLQAGCNFCSACGTPVNTANRP